MPHFSGKPFSPARRQGSHVAGLVALSAGLLAAASGLPVPRAEAQGLFGVWDAPTYKVRKKAKRPPPSVVSTGTETKSRKAKDAEVAERPAEGPLVVSVSLARQRLTVYDASGPIASSPISSGRVGYATPTGVFTILQKRRMHYSNLYDSAPMPNMQRLTWSGVALHAGALPGYPASHGCIRLPHGFSKKLFGMTKMNTRVIVTRDPVAPKPIEHARLFTAFPPDEDIAVESAPAAQETQVADASGVLGVTTAAAAAEPEAATHTPLSYRERRRLEAEKLTVEIRTTGYAKVSKEIQLWLAHTAAVATRKPLIAARADAERLDEQLRTLEESLADAERTLADLKAPPEETTKRKRKKKAMDQSKRIAKIATLEEKVSRLPSEIEATRAASTHANEALRAAENVAKEAEDKRSAAMNAFSEARAAHDRSLAKEQAARKLEAMRDRTVSIFISRAKQRLYVRQGYDDIFDAEVTFDRPDEPVGTHVFTALAVAENKTDMKWNVVSVPHDPTRGKAKKKDKQAKAEPAPKIDLSAQTAAAALDRITIPDDVREQIADVMKPGSSLVISDLPIGNETGAYTDFIVPIR